MKKSTKSFLIGSGVAAGVAALAAVYHQTVKHLTAIALDRQQPPMPLDMEKSRNLLMGSDELSSMMSTIMDAAAVLESRDCETVEIVAHDGIPLVGHWLCPPNPKRIIVAMHGWRSSWSQDFGLIADFWYQNDCAVLYAEQRGQGDSGGEYMGFGLLERYDCRDWITYLDAKFEGKLPLYPVGISMGATTVLMTAGFSLPDSVRGIIADCGFTSPSAIWKHVIEKNLRLPYALYKSAADQLCRQKIQVSADDYCCTDAMKQCAVPILFIHGTDDKFVPVEMTYENYKACTAEKRLFVVPGADHGLSYLTDKNGYESIVKAFWNDLESR